MTQTLSTERMKALYAVAQKHNLAIVEDDAYFWIQMPGLDVPSTSRSLTPSPPAGPPGSGDRSACQS